MDTITIQEMLAEMETGNPFSIKFVSFDKQRKTGGEVRSFPALVLNQKNKAKEPVKSTSDNPLNDVVKKTRNPNHFKNATRAARVMIGGCITDTIKKFHIFLILEFNNKKLII